MQPAATGSIIGQGFLDRTWFPLSDRASIIGQASAGSAGSHKMRGVDDVHRKQSEGLSKETHFVLDAVCQVIVQAGPCSSWMQKAHMSSSFRDP